MTIKKEKRVCNNGPAAYTDALFYEGVIGMKQYDFKVPVYKQVNVGSPVLMIGQRVGKIYPIGHRVEDSFLVHKLIDRRLEIAPTGFKKLRYPSGTITKLPVNPNTKKRTYTVLFVTEVNKKLV